METGDVVVITLKCQWSEATVVMNRLAPRRPTYWVDGGHADYLFSQEAGPVAEARFWVSIPGIEGRDTARLPTLRQPQVTGLVCRSDHFWTLRPHLRTVLEGIPCVVSEMESVHLAQELRESIRIRTPAFSTTRARAAQGVVVLPEDLHIIRAQRAWVGKTVLVLPDTFSTPHRPEDKIRAFARLAASYLQIGATHVVVPSGLLCFDGKPVQAYDLLVARIQEFMKTA